MIPALAVIFLFTLWFFVIFKLGIHAFRLVPMSNRWYAWGYFSVVLATAANAALIALFS